MPHSKCWSTKASANTSGPQAFACDIGVRKKPNAERGAKPSSEMRHPHRMMIAGVRQPIERAVWAIWIMGNSRAGLAESISKCAAPSALTDIRDWIYQFFAWLRLGRGDSQLSATHAI